MNELVGSEWLDQNIWPQIQAMILQDAYFKLMGHARILTGKFNGPIAWLTYVGYINSQTIAIRRLVDPGRNVISLRRVLHEAKQSSQVNARFDELASKVDRCDTICDLVSQHTAHMANPVRNQTMQV